MKTSISLFLTLWVASIPAQAAGVRIKCWTDETGQRSCGDSVPPKYAGHEHQDLNKQGVPVQTTPRALTPEEREQRDRERAKAAEEEKAAQRRHAYDRYLVESYTSAKDLEEQRDTRIHALDTRIELVKKAIASSQGQLDALVQRKQALQKENKPVDKKLEGQIQEYRRALRENPRTLDALNMERDKVTAQFDNDIARFRELRNETTAAQPY
jgi:hypothetical protein